MSRPPSCHISRLYEIRIVQESVISGLHGTETRQQVALRITVIKVNATLVRLEEVARFTEFLTRLITRQNPFILVVGYPYLCPDRRIAGKSWARGSRDRGRRCVI